MAKRITPEQQARIDLAAALRSASRMGLGEGICNHFSVEVPGRAGQIASGTGLYPIPWDLARADIKEHAA